MLIFIPLQKQPWAALRSEVSLNKSNLSYSISHWLSASEILVKIDKAVPEVSWNGQTNKNNKKYFYVNTVDAFIGI